MPSASLLLWASDRIAGLNEVDTQCAATHALANPNPQLVDENLRGFILLLSAHFQGYCRDLYSECASIIAFRIRATMRVLVQRQFDANRLLDHGNPSLDVLKKDFNRFGFTLDMAAHDPANHARLAHLKQLNRWRNIAAHHGIVPPEGLPPLTTVQDWKNSCNGLATSLDDILYNQLRRTLRRSPWGR